MQNKNAPPAPEGPASTDWPDIREWRRQRRTMLLEVRVQAGRRQRQEWADGIEPRLRAILDSRETGILGFYWPFKGEYDARKLVDEYTANGWSAALPAVVEPKTPLEFRAWAPGEPLIPGIWKIPVPEQRHIVTPTVLLVPLVGFDLRGYRLGYGGGYYDRTIASFTPRPFAIGIGFEQGRLATIYPQTHDIPMDIIVTEAGGNEP